MTSEVYTLVLHQRVLITSLISLSKLLLCCQKIRFLNAIIFVDCFIFQRVRLYLRSQIPLILNWYCTRALTIDLKCAVGVRRIPLIILDSLHIAICAISVACLILETVQIIVLELIGYRVHFVCCVGMAIIPQVDMIRFKLLILFLVREITFRE